MADDTTTGLLHMTVDADVRVTDPARLCNPSDAQVGEALAELIRPQAWEAGLQVVDPRSVQVMVTPAS